jgi:mono/diheme cytochrome c family protein
MARGRDRFEIFCQPCHGPTGAGNGMVVQRGHKVPPSWHIERLQKETPGYWFDVATNGFGAMYGYAAQIAPRDRWAIIVYVRALQLSQAASSSDIPEAIRAEVVSGRRLADPASSPSPPAERGGSH